MVLSSFFQKRVSNFAIKVLLLDATITEQNMRVNILEVGDLTKPEKLIMYKSKEVNNIDLIAIMIL